MRLPLWRQCTVVHWSKWHELLRHLVGAVEAEAAKAAAEYAARRRGGVAGLQQGHGVPAVRVAKDEGGRDGHFGEAPFGRSVGENRFGWVAALQQLSADTVRAGGCHVDPPPDTLHPTCQSYIDNFPRWREEKFCGCWPRSWWSRRRWRSPSPHAAEVLLVAVAGFGLVAVAGLALHILEC